MVGYHLAQHGQMPRLLFDDENPKSSDPTKHVVYKEDEGKIVIHTGRFKMKQEKIMGKLRGFECEIGIDGQTKHVEVGFTPMAQGNAAADKGGIVATDLGGYLTPAIRGDISPERQEKYYTEKKAPLKDSNSEDDNERLEEQFNNIPNKGPNGSNSSIQNIANKYGNPVTPQQPAPQPNVQQPKDDIWLTDRIPYDLGLQEQGIDKLLGFKPSDAQPYQAADTVRAIEEGSSSWAGQVPKMGTLRLAVQRGGHGARRVIAGNNNNFNNNYGYNNMMNQNMGGMGGNQFQNMMGNNQFQGMMGNQNQGVMGNNQFQNMMGNNQFQNMMGNNQFQQPNNFNGMNNNNMMNNLPQPNNNYNNNFQNMNAGPNQMVGGLFNQQNYPPMNAQNYNAGLNGQMMQGQNQGGPFYGANNNYNGNNFGRSGNY